MEKAQVKLKLEELLNRLQAQKDNAAKADLLIKIASTIRSSNPEEATKYAFEGLKLSESAGYKKGIANCLMSIGIIHQYKGEYAEALEFYYKSLEVNRETGDEKSISDCLNNIGIIHYEQGDYPRALEFYQESLKKKRELGDTQGISSCLNNIGSVYWHQGDYSQALRYYHESLEIKVETDDKAGISSCLNNIGAVYKEQGDFLRALEYYGKSLEIRKEMDDKIGISYCLNNIGVIYMSRKDYGLALENFKKTLEMNEELGDKNGISGCYINIGRLHVKNGDFRDALDCLTKGLEIAKEIGALDLEMEAYGSLSEAWEKSSDHAKALEYHRLYKDANDRLFGQKQTRKIAQLESRLEFEKKEREIEILKHASITDPLTKISNRQGLWEKINSEITRFRRHKKPFVVAIADIDDFKVFNDKYGHDCGDSVLVAFARILENSTTESGHIGRWGGEEFLIILPETESKQGFEIVEQIRNNIEKYPHNHKGKSLHITASFGLSEYRGESDIAFTIEEADRALYEAKTRGKNRCVVDSEL